MFSWLSPSPPPPPAAPDRARRAACWAARDAYFACLDAQKVLAPGDEPPAACARERKAYDGSCVRSWVEYFNKRRVLQEEQKDQLAVAQAQAAEAHRKR